MIGWQELAVVLLIILILFGHKRIPELARALGLGIFEFKKGVEEGKKKEKK
jgi:sec-independent protein translocase protein TatA